MTKKPMADPQGLRTSGGGNLAKSTGTKAKGGKKGAGGGK